MLNEDGLKFFTEQLGTVIHPGRPVYKLNYLNIDAQNRRIIADWLPIYYKNIVENYHKINQEATLSDLKGTLRNKPAVIVAPGPSLDDVIQKIYKIKDDVIIIACDSVLQYLEANNIYPHYIVNAHCLPKLKNCFEGINTEKYTLITPTTCDKEVFEVWKGRLLFYNNFHTNMEFYDVCLPTLFPKMAQIPNAGSVAGTCVHVARIMSCNPIILCGVDFGFPDNKYKCRSYNRNGHGWTEIPVDHDKINNNLLVEHKGTKCWEEHLFYREAILNIIQILPLVLVRGSQCGILEHDLPCIDLSEKIDIDKITEIVEKNTYEKLWKTSYIPSKVAIPMGELIAKGCHRKDIKMLDMGCGNGTTVNSLREKGFNCYGLDLTIAGVKGDKQYFVESNILNMPYPDDYFDLTFSTDMLEHLPTEWVEKAIREIFRVTKKYTVHCIATFVDANRGTLHKTVKPIPFWQDQFSKLNNKNIGFNLIDSSELRKGKITECQMNF